MSPNQTAQSGNSGDHVSHIAAPSKYRAMSTANLYSEEERLETFRDWPSSKITPEELAANGFYYTGVEDVTRCAFCGLEVGQWENGDTAEADHKRFSPSCDFLRGSSDNIPRGSQSPSSSPPSYDTCGPFGHLIRPYSGPERACIASLPSTLLKDLEHLGVSKTSGPANEAYCSEEARLRSFTNWPETCPVRPAALAAAGFYSNGKKDQTICFHCGGGLKDWEEGDDPWVEHARWFSRCAFVLMRKGREFVSSVIQKNSALLPAEAVNELLEQGSESRDEDVTGASCIKSAASQPVAAPSSEESECKLGDMEICKVCYARERAIVFLPCGHFVSCADCASSVTRCPLCRQPYEATVRAYLS